MIGLKIYMMSLFIRMMMDSAEYNRCLLSAHGPPLRFSLAIKFGPPCCEATARFKFVVFSETLMSPSC